jgi:ribonuclease P protein component
VDELPTDWWLGMVVPKRHARRSVTRNLIKRQMREVMGAVVQQARQAPSEGLPCGLWVLRLKSPFDPKQFSSPASVPLRQAAREEIALLLTRALTPLPADASPGRRPRRGASSGSPGPVAVPLHSAPSA